MAKVGAFSVRSWLALLGFLILPTVVSATPITQFFEFSATTGPLAPFTDIGFFTYDDSIVPPGGGEVSATDLLTDLSLSVGGTPFDETTANTGGFFFDPSGRLSIVIFGTNCYVGGCSVSSGTDDWYIMLSAQSTAGLFVYATVDGGLYITRESRLIDEPVPEPGTMLLLGSGLLGLAARRRRSA